MAGKDDDIGERDQESIINEYKNREGSQAERLAIHNAVRGSKRAQLYYDYDENVKEDVGFDLEEIDKIEIGDEFRVRVSQSIMNLNITVLLTSSSWHVVIYPAKAS